MTTGGPSPSSATSPVTVAPVRKRTPGSARAARRSTHSKVVRRTIEHLEVFVARLRLAEVGGHRQDQAADRQQLVEDVGEVLAQLHEDAGEEPVGLVDLRRAPSLGLERLLGVGPRRERVALDDGDLVAGPAEGERERQPADPAAHHHDPFPHRHAAPRVW